MTDSNNSTNSSYYSGFAGYDSYSVYETSVIVFLSCIITAFALPGNITVIFIIARVPNMRTTTNLLLLNLCIADLLIAVLHLPFVTVDLYITEEWIFGAFMCRLVSFSKSVGTKASILILMALSVERYLTICRPNRVFITTKRIQVVCASLWLVAMGVALPYFIFKDEVSDEETGMLYCVEKWSPTPATVYTFLLFAVFYLFPLLVMIVLYIKITQKLWESTRRTNSMRVEGRVCKATATSKSRLTKICVIIVLSFAISWAPSHIFTFIYYCATTDDVDFFILSKIAYPIVAIVAFSNCALNPFLYCFMSQNFRNAIVSEWKRITTRRQQRLYHGLPGLSLRSRDSMLRTISTRLQLSLPSKGSHTDDNDDGRQSVRTSVTVFESAL